MQDLNCITSCPCFLCRLDPDHKNKSVEIVKKRNGKQKGLIRRHSWYVKQKYGFKCALSDSTYELHHHHLDSQDFYVKVKSNWQFNGICLCGTIHRDYHYNFLLNHSVIAKLYFNIDSTQAKIKTEELKTGAEVSRYTFLEYLKFLQFDILMNNSSYVNDLNHRCLIEQLSISLSDPQFGCCKKITVKKLKQATKKFCLEYKRNNWKFSKCSDIPYANDSYLWDQVDRSWQ